MSSLCHDIKATIFSFLKSKEQRKCRIVCHEWKNIISDYEHISYRIPICIILDNTNIPIDYDEYMSTKNKNFKKAVINLNFCFNKFILPDKVLMGSNLEEIIIINSDVIIKIGDHFLSENRKLEIVSFEGLSALQTVGNNWMSSCKSLKKLI